MSLGFSLKCGEETALELSARIVLDRKLLKIYEQVHFVINRG